MSVLGCALWGLGLVGCSSEGENLSAHQSGEVNLELELSVNTLSKFTKVDLLSLDSVEVRVSSADMNSVVHKAAFDEGVLEVPSFPAGDARVVEAYLYDSNGDLMFQGDTLMSFAGGVQNLALNIFQEFGVIKAEMALGWFSAVGSGGLDLVVADDTLKTDLELKNGLGVFELTKIPFGKNYSLSIDILDTLGASMFSIDTVVDVLRGQTENLSFKLTPQLSQLSLRLNINEEVHLNIDLENEAALLIKPRRGHLIITELMPNPKVSGDSLEWIELANLGGDSLDLSGCSLRKTMNSTTASSYLDLSGLVIAPAQMVVLGREQMNLADWNYSDFTMSNSTGTMLLVCDDVQLDSLAWTEGEPVGEELLSGQSKSITIDDLKLSEGLVSWCNSSKNMLIGELELYGSPGEFESCLEE